MNDNRKKYELFAQMDPVKFMDFMIDFLDNLGMNIKYYELEIPFNCDCCPYYAECSDYRAADVSCLEYLSTKLKPDEVI